MGITVDIVIIAIILLSTILAYRKGFVKLSISLFSFIIAIIVTFLLYQPISNLIINGTGIDDAIEDAIYEKTNEIMQNPEEGLTDEIMETAKNEMLPETVRNLSINIVKGGVAIVLFLAIRIGLRFATALADLIAKLPLLKQINKVGGLVYGILRGIVIIYVALLILTVSEQVSPNNSVNQGINQSYIGKTMYENNILKIFF